MTRFSFGKSQLNYYMHIMKMHKDGTCDECRIPETVEHFILNTRRTNCLQMISEKYVEERIIQMTLSAILTDNDTNTITDYIIKSKRRI